MESREYTKVPQVNKTVEWRAFWACNSGKGKAGDLRLPVSNERWKTSFSLFADSLGELWPPMLLSVTLLT